MKIDLVNLTCGYNKIPVLKNIDLSFKEGNWYFFVGIPGSGKTTLLNTISGFLKKIDGEILINENPLSDRSIFKQYQKDLGVISTLYETENYHQTGREKIFSLLKCRERERENIKKRFNSIVKLLSISDETLNTKFSELDEENKRFIILASLLITRPKILILDEPVKNFTEENKKIFFKALQFLKNKGVLIIQSSSQIQDAKDADNVIVLANKKIIAQGKPEYLIQSEELKEEANLNQEEKFEKISDKNLIDIPLKSRKQKYLYLSGTIFILLIILFLVYNS